MSILYYLKLFGMFDEIDTLQCARKNDCKISSHKLSLLSKNSRVWLITMHHPWFWKFRENENNEKKNIEKLIHGYGGEKLLSLKSVNAIASLYVIKSKPQSKIYFENDK